MCLNPLRIRNPTHRIAKAGGNKMYLEVPCNKCAECVSSIRNEWYFRTYQEVISTLKNGGYIYFDTLTYSNEHLPHLSDFVDFSKYPNIHDFTCFCHDHFKLFLKRLRRQLEYYYGENEFRYFLTSEYGTDDRYTHRPHYHILFFVNSKIPPLAFSEMVAKCWQYGRTDGRPFKSIKYVSQHIYGYNLGFGNNDDFSSISSVCMYVSKYITKSSKFMDKLNARMNMLKFHIVDPDELNTLKRSIDMFHRQSQGFGESYLYGMDKEKISDVLDYKCKIFDKDKVVKELPLPMYYRRKLFYINKKKDDGTRYWELSPLGAFHHINYMIKSVDDNVALYRKYVVNMNDNDKELLYKYLDGRTLDEYALYKVFYENRIRIDTIYELNDIEYNVLDWSEIVKQSFFANSLPYGLVYEISDDDNIHLTFDSDFFSATSYINDNVFNSKSCYEFRNYDKIDALFKRYRKYRDIKTQGTFDYIEDCRDRLKDLFNI